MKETIIQQCLDMLKKNDVKLLLTPIIDMILYEINPYIYMVIILLSFIFILILAILVLLILLLRNRSFFFKIL
jgi:hypothetical protein